MLKPAPPAAPHLRKVRSFVRRQGRMSPGQRHVLEDLEPRYCLDAAQQCDFTEVFGRSAPLIVEIGFGNGDTLADMAAANPGCDYLGIEVHRPGVAQLLGNLERRGIGNVRVFCHDAVEILQSRIADNSLAAVHLFFPDPWPKKKHHKRRIVQAAFMELVVRKLTAGGYFHAATDWQDYAYAMREVLKTVPQLQKADDGQDFSTRPEYRPLTKFEKRGLRLGHGVWDLIYRKTA